MIPAAILLVVVILAIVGPLIAPHHLDLGPCDRFDSHVPPVWHSRGSWNNVLGTDFDGRDLLSLAMYDARNYGLIVAVVLAISAATSTIPALVAAYVGGPFKHSWPGLLALLWPFL